MADPRAYLEKALEALAGAESEAAQKRYNNAANRLCYACFLAAIAALIEAGVDPGRVRWDHDAVQAQFDGLLIRRRHLYPSDLRGVLASLEILREKADYREAGVSRAAVNLEIRQARRFIAEIIEVIGNGQAEGV
jgi:uncharacterized protein (UPF0332 family)